MRFPCPRQEGPTEWILVRVRNGSDITNDTTYQMVARGTWISEMLEWEALKTSGPWMSFWWVTNSLSSILRETTQNLRQLESSGWKWLTLCNTVLFPLCALKCDHFLPAIWYEEGWEACSEISVFHMVGLLSSCLIQYHLGASVGRGT